MAKQKKQNFIVSYFKPFGLRQICDIVMLLGAILLIVGLCVYSKPADILIVVGLALIIAVSIISIIRLLRVLLSPINKRSPEYKNAIINTCIATAILIIATIGIITYFTT